MGVGAFGAGGIKTLGAVGIRTALACVAWPICVVAAPAGNELESHTLRSFD